MFFPRIKKKKKNTSYRAQQDVCITRLLVYASGRLVVLVVLVLVVLALVVLALVLVLLFSFHFALLLHHPTVC